MRPPFIEMRAIGSAQSALGELAKLLPDRAERLAPDGSLERVSVSELREGDLVLVRPGTQIPSDGRVEEGKSQVNESMITGESRLVDKQPGNEAIATLSLPGLKQPLQVFHPALMFPSLQHLLVDAEYFVVIQPGIMLPR